MYYGAAESWNLRDAHMFETLRSILDAKGPKSKAIVWAHNSHIGNAAATEMGQVRDELNLGQLAREHFGENAALIGFGTHTGTVACADDWDGPMQVKAVNPSLRNSYECHYSSCSLPEQFDVYVWFDETMAVTPLPGPERAGAEETYPFGL
jgi:erythromycin esterase-like protein